jgi:hypothetical protein
MEISNIEVVHYDYVPKIHHRGRCSPCVHEDYTIASVSYRRTPVKGMLTMCRLNRNLGRCLIDI